MMKQNFATLLLVDGDAVVAVAAEEVEEVEEMKMDEKPCW
jgi:hypothetical protein